MRLFVVFATHRSGHHGVLNWICSQHGDITHYNNAHLTKNRLYFRATRPDIGITEYGRRHSLLINLEGFRFGRWVDESWGTTAAVEKFDDVQPVLVLRRFRNWLASTARHPGNNCMRKSKPDPKMVAKWDNMVGNYRDHLAVAITGKSPFDNLIVIRFDDWFTSIDYRETLAHRLDIPFTDAGLNEVPRFAAGSTFDRRKFDGHAQEMDVVNRWKQAEGTEPYERYLAANRDLDELSEKLFSQPAPCARPPLPRPSTDPTDRPPE